ncbi:MAG: cytochrome c biogenesis protein CcdA [Candidatus Beckwithbacteria bacterium]|nr:cytochrome c biogenesis protein CcdA [Candidatus Beckwithbacteria bacterium]
MNEFSQVSLIASFIAGMVALFAPCCFSYLLPAYFGNIFKEKKRVILMTLVYSLGIFTVMLPVVLGAKVLAGLIFKLHDQTYVLGSLFMILVAVLAFLGIKLPMPQITQKQPGKPDMVSTFTLGLFAGVTSSCCAPVLLGVITLSAFTPGLAASLLIGAVYVLGMVTPLYLASAFIDQKKLLEKPIMKRQVTTLVLGRKTYPIFVSNIIAGVTFGATGIIMLYLTLTGRLGMPEPAKLNLSLNSFTQNQFLNVIFVIIGLLLLYKFVKRGLR